LQPENPYVSPVGPATPTVPPSQSDYDHLRWLSIAYYIMGAISGLCACIPAVYLALGAAMVTGAFNAPQNQNGPPPELGWLFIVVAIVLIGLGWAMATALLVTGRNLSRCQGYTFCFVVAVAAMLLSQPFGTILGIFTLIVLLRPSVKQLFEQARVRA
jgi:hypothetical protein